MLSNAEQCWAMLSNAEQCWAMLRNAEKPRAMATNRSKCPKIPFRTQKIPILFWKISKMGHFVKPYFPCSELYRLAWRSINGRSKKSGCNEKSIFSHPTTMQRNFWNPFTLVLYFYNFWPELQMATITSGDKMFDWKLVSIVFTTCRIGISGLILNLRAMGLT